MTKAMTKQKRHELETSFTATIMGCRNKKRWHLASELLRLEHELIIATMRHKHSLTDDMEN
jgi:hypothetical protein